MLADLQSLCERGQELLMSMDYIGAETALVEAEAIALRENDFDTLSRLYMPLQEARRQRRQRCGEGIVRLDIVASSPDERIDAEQIIDNYPHGQLLVAGWGTIEPALRLRKLQKERSLYVETFLAAVFKSKDGMQTIVIAPDASTQLPTAQRASELAFKDLLAGLPPTVQVLSMNALPFGERQGSPQTFAEVMNRWERLHDPFLHDADECTDPLEKIAAYRRTIDVDYACELAHQRLSATAHELTRSRS